MGSQARPPCRPHPCVSPCAALAAIIPGVDHLPPQALDCRDYGCRAEVRDNTLDSASVQPCTHQVVSQTMLEAVSSLSDPALSLFNIIGLWWYRCLFQIQGAHRCLAGDLTQLDRGNTHDREGTHVEHNVDVQSHTSSTCFQFLMFRLHVRYIVQFLIFTEK